MNGIKWFIRENGIVNFILIFSTERRLLEKHLVDQDTKCPPINSTAVLLVEKNLKKVSTKKKEGLDTIDIPREP
jgi:hypothetical protein